jgi:two-component system, cell cycle response regulator
VTAASTILIADDSVVVRAVVRDHLEHEGYVVEEAEDGAQAVAVCADLRPDAVLLDIEMPGLDGREVLRELKADPLTSDIPVVFLTGLSTTDDLVAGLRAGAHDYLRKPFEPAELLARIGSAVAIKRLQDELRRRNDELDRVSRVDVLTGLYNRRHLEEHLRRLGEDARRSGEPLGVALFDVDRFKLINDTHGHAGGDVVLQGVAETLRRGTRASEIVGRWGGEEFLLLLPRTSSEDVVVTADRIRADLASAPIGLTDGAVAVTVSAGCATSLDGDTWALVNRADAALYRAKENGRNRVEVAAPMP